MITFGIIIVLLILTLLISLQFYFNTNLLLKLAVVTYLFIISSVAYFSFDSYFGWPTPERIKAIRVVAVEVVEPAPNKEGAIFVWGYNYKFPQGEKPTSWMDIANYDGDGQPRAYRLEYTKERGDDMQNAKKKLQKGAHVYIFNEDKLPETGNLGEVDGVETKSLKDKDSGVQKSIKRGNRGSVMKIVDPRVELRKE